MKLKTKLIPIAAVAVTAASIVPISLTSCSKNEQIKMNDISTAELAKPADIEKYVDGKNPLTEETASETYYNLIKREPKLFVQDLAWGVYKNWYSYFDENNFDTWVETSGPDLYYKYSSKLTSLKFGATNPTITTKTIRLRDGRGEVTYPAISFKMKVEVKADVQTTVPNLTETESSTVSRRNILFTCESEFKDVLFFAYTGYADYKADYFNRRLVKTTASNNSQAQSELNKQKVVTTEPCWYITNSTLTEDQSVLDDYFDDWYVKYTTKYTIDNEVYDTGTHSTTEFTDEGGNEGIINTRKSFEELTRLKRYVTNYDAFWGWFDNTSDSLLANAVLLDMQSYYFEDAYVPSKLVTEDEIGDILKYETAETVFYTLKGWYFIPPKWDEIDNIQYMYFNYYVVQDDGTEVLLPQLTLEELWGYHSSDYDMSLTFYSGKEEHHGEPNFVFDPMNEEYLDIPCFMNHCTSDVGNLHYQWPSNVVIHPVVKMKDELTDKEIELGAQEIVCKNIYIESSW